MYLRLPSLTAMRWSLVMLVSATSSLNMHAQIDRSKAPSAAKAPLVELAEHKSFELKNGMRVIVVEDHKLPLVSAQVKVDIEPVHQSQMAGYVELTGDLLGSGTTTMTKEKIDEAVDGLGAELRTSSDGVYASSLKKNFPQVLNIVADVLRNPTFPEEEFQKAKVRMLSSVQSRKEDPDAIAREVGKVLTYSKGHPYGDVVTEKSLEQVMQKHVQSYYKRFFQPKDTYLVLVGDITEKEARTLAEKLFGDWNGVPFGKEEDKSGREMVDGIGPVGRAAKLPQAAKVRQVTIVDRPGAAQSVIQAVFPVELEPKDPRVMDAMVMNTILGGGVFNARLMQNLREDKGYTYGAHSYLGPDRYIGSFYAGASVRTEVTDSAIVELMTEMERMRLENVTKEELTLAKNYMAGSFARSLEDPRTVARFALNTFLYDLPKDHYRTYLKRLDTVTVAGVRSAANAFLLPDNARILVVGAKEMLANKITLLAFDQRLNQLDENGDRYRETFEAAPAGMTPQLVLDAYFKALGGKEALSKVRSVRTDMTATMGGMPLSVTQYNVAPNKYAVEMKSGGMTLQKIIVDGVRGMQESPEGRTEIIEMDLEDMINEASPFPELNYDDLGFQMTLSGVSEINGQKAYRVMVLRDNGGAVTDHFSVETGLKLRREEKKASSVGTMSITTDYKDHREVKGVKFPFLLVQKGPMELNLAVTDITVNGPIPDDLFKLE